MTDDIDRSELLAGIVEGLSTGAQMAMPILLLTERTKAIFQRYLYLLTVGESATGAYLAPEQAARQAIADLKVLADELAK